MKRNHEIHYSTMLEAVKTASIKEDKFKAYEKTVIIYLTDR